MPLLHVSLVVEGATYICLGIGEGAGAEEVQGDGRCNGVIFSLPTYVCLCFGDGAENDGDGRGKVVTAPFRCRVRRKTGAAGAR